MVAGNGDLRAAFVAEARQNIHRINLFADVVWALLGLILSALGTIGLALPRHELLSTRGIKTPKCKS